MQRHLTQSIVMVEPLDFGFNEETGLDNEFQNRPNQAQLNEAASKALKEFRAMVKLLINNGIHVDVLQKASQVKTPDAVFPNNWFSTRENGDLVIYPMKAKNRQAEVQKDNLSKQLSLSHFKINRTIDLRLQSKHAALEGTGSLIFHHPTNSLFAAISERCDKELLNDFASQFNYQLYDFKSQSQSGKPIYHTNVLMSCGEKFCVLAEEVLIKDEQAAKAIAKLKAISEDYITISESQMAESFCGNIIQLKNNRNEPCIVMSQSAFDGFTSNQIKALERHGKLIPCPIPTIENIGGGSARCMIAENFLPCEQ